jgi:hypothetical protein
LRIDFDGAGSRRLVRVGAWALVAFAVVCPVYVIASQVGPLVHFKPGQVIASADMNANFQAIKTAVNDNDTRIGNLGTLTTTAKTDLVSAINEVNAVTGNFLPLAGGTLTGPITGTGATFTGETLTGALTGTDATFTGPLTGTVATFVAPGSTPSKFTATGVPAAQTGTTAGSQGDGALAATGGVGGAAASGTGGNGGNGGTFTGGNGGQSTGAGGGFGGIGIAALGGFGGSGSTTNGLGGPGVFAAGGAGAGGGGSGIFTTGGPTFGAFKGGDGVNATGGSGGTAALGGTGIVAAGGPGATGGLGLEAQGGTGTSTQGDAAAFLGNVTIFPFKGQTGDLTVSGTLTSATTNIDGILTASGASNTFTSGVMMNSGLNVGGNLTVTGTNNTFTNDVTVNNNLYVTKTVACQDLGAGNGVTAAVIGCSGTISGAMLQISGTKTFRIDHPLDPDNKFLCHSCVESPDMMNIYNGNVVLDAKGEATISLPAYFEALNKDFRYQLTCVGGAALVYIAEKIHANHFKIAGGREGLEVSWQVTGIRKDAYAEAHRVQVEVQKSPSERGRYLQPVELGKDPSLKIHPGPSSVEAKQSN